MLSRWQAGARHTLRSFSSSAPSCAGIVSNIGKKPIVYPPSVTLSPSPTAISVKGPLGETSIPLMPFVQLDHSTPNTLAVTVQEPKQRKQRAMWGLTRTLIENAIIGMTQGFTTPVYLVGVGYRAALEEDPRGKGDGRSGQRLNMKLGFSHPVFVSIPEHIKVAVPLPTKIVLSCTDKHQLGLFAAEIRRWRPPEPYKGKGIIVGNERIRMKTVKKK
ncbi:ribosomal protein L6 [Earliella scabrosa]|nr:ribosomal protein L6 [Earliella scabrosa]